MIGVVFEFVFAVYIIVIGY